MKFLLTLTLAVSHLCAFAQNSAQLEVAGVGRFEATPDVAVLKIDLRTIRMEFSEAVSALTSDYEQMVKHLQNEGFIREEIKTSEYGIRPNWIYRMDKSYDSGFVGYQSLQVEFANTKENLTKATMGIAKSPVKARLSITFEVSESLLGTIRNELIKKAIEDARQKAKLMADASGQQLGEIVKVAYPSDSWHRLSSNEYRDPFMGLSSPVEELVIKEEISYTVKEVKFEDEVVVTYDLKQ